MTQASPTRALIIAEPWIGLILAGRKTWEMRTKPTAIRGRIGLIRKGSGLVVGTAEMSECLPSLDAATYGHHADQHGIAPEHQPRALAGGWVVPWVLRDVRWLQRSVPYTHPSGAVIWVTLEEAVSRAVAAQGDIATAAAPTLAVSLRPKRVDRPEASSSPKRPMTTAAVMGVVGSTGRVRLTGGNIRHGHIYLRTIERLFPADAIGGSSAANAAARRITVVFDPGPTIETDIPADKMILRARGPVRTFFEASGAQEGDEVAISRTAAYAFHIALCRRQPG